MFYTGQEKESPKGGSDVKGVSAESEERGTAKASHTDHPSNRDKEDGDGHAVVRTVVGIGSIYVVVSVWTAPWSKV